METVKETELRIGNLVSQNGYPGLVYSIESALPRREERFNDKVVITLYDSGLATVTLDQVSAVTLTEEWLLKFGFKKENNTIYSISDTLSSSEVGKWYFFKNENDSFTPNIKRENKFSWIGKDINYVHQLQNIYFALTGEELTLN
jgi:hypothetical protein